MRNPLRHWMLAAALWLSMSSAASAATLTIVNIDGPGEGFNDATPATPVGGNPGTTIGAQRLYVFQYAASIWGSLLTSAVGESSCTSAATSPSKPISYRRPVSPGMLGSPVIAAVS